MAEPYVGEIRMFGGNFAPAGWAFCNGQLLSIAEYEVLFTLIGTTYGGNGTTTFALPNLQGRLPIHMGPGYTIGQSAGTETVTLTQQQLPQHNHTVGVNTGAALSVSPQSAFLASPSAGHLYIDDQPSAALNANSIGLSAGNQPHENLPPFLAISFIISLFGIFPSQT